MNAYLEHLMDKPSLTPDWCVVCGKPTKAGPHHVVPRGQGGHDGPVLRLCGSGTTGHHGMAEDKMLHFRYEEGWEFLITCEPKKYEYALGMRGWRRLPHE